MSSLRQLVRARAPLRNHTPSLFASRRALTQTAAARLPYKDDMDRESLKPKAHEYTHSGTDEQTAQNPDAAFNPDKTSPEAERETAGQGNASNPLGASPANKEFAEAGQGKPEDKPHGGQSKSSGGGSAPKSGKVV
ncbi:hypothetical protein F4780DRAFT_777254 [Xylariomycetidae sp. FL0641]|nr:hypothetical protein F4780DRAFT_777254 [Xylariomycetidae sp. FL0641]